MYIYVCNASAVEMHQAWFYTHTLPTVLDTKLCTGHAYTCVISMNMIWDIITAQRFSGVFNAAFGSNLLREQNF